MFQNKCFTFFAHIKPKGFLSLRFSMGYIDAKDEVYEITLDL
jgi:hypothetical protein